MFCTAVATSRPRSVTSSISSALERVGLAARGARARRSRACRSERRDHARAQAELEQPRLLRVAGSAHVLAVDGARPSAITASRIEPAAGSRVPGEQRVRGDAGRRHHPRPPVARRAGSQRGRTGRAPAAPRTNASNAASSSSDDAERARARGSPPRAGRRAGPARPAAARPPRRARRRPAPAPLQLDEPARRRRRARTRPTTRSATSPTRTGGVELAPRGRGRARGGAGTSRSGA